MFSKYQEEYYKFFLEGNEDYKNYEYHLEGIIALYEKGIKMSNNHRDFFNLFFSWKTIR